MLDWFWTVSLSKFLAYHHHHIMQVSHGFQPACAPYWFSFQYLLIDCPSRVIKWSCEMGD